ncbi:hypothetical protein AKJ16_DCAP24405 [Drosera capensis]
MGDDEGDGCHSGRQWRWQRGSCDGSEREGFTVPSISIYIAAAITSPPAPPPLRHLPRCRILERFDYGCSVGVLAVDCRLVGAKFCGFDVMCIVQG